MPWRLGAAAIGRVPPEAGQLRLARRLRPRLPAPAERLAFRLASGASIELDVRDRLQAELYLTGAWEPRIQNFIVERVGPGGTFVDVGANVGLTSLSVAARLAGTGVRIHAFEPSEANARAFRSNLDRNAALAAAVRLTAVAVGAEAGELALRFGGESGHHHLTTDGNGDALVPVVSLGDYAAEHDLHSIDCLKVDVEGWEVEVLRGAEPLLREHRIRAVVCEVEDVLLRRAGSSPRELVGLMLGHGYVPVALERLPQRVRGALVRTPAPPRLDGDVAFVPVEETA